MISTSIKVVVLTSLPNCKILLDDYKLPILEVTDTHEQTARNYVKDNFGYDDSFALVKLLGINEKSELVDEFRGCGSLITTKIYNNYIVFYYMISVAEETKVKQGQWIDLSNAGQILPAEDFEFVQKGINQWLY